MRKDIAFRSSGLTLRGWFYRAQDRTTPAPTIILSHGFSAVKEQGLDGFAERFQRAGFNALVFDYRNLGASDGAERGRIIAQEQHDDIRAALAHASSLDGVDPDRLGLWGTSYSGGHALFVGMLDPRVKAIVVQAPAVSVARSLIALAGADGFGRYLALLADDHARRTAGEEGGRIPIVAPQGEASVLATPDSHDWFHRMASLPGSTWHPDTTLESVARMAEYDAGAFVGLVPPKPLLLVAALRDSLIPIDQVRDVYMRAGEPKALVEFDCGHFDFYPGGTHHDEAAARQVEWFARHLS